MGRSVRQPLLACVCLCGLSLQARADAGAAQDQATAGLRASGYYLHVSPAFGIDVHAPRFRPFGWGVGGGRFWAVADSFAVAVGGFFEHLVWVNEFRERPGATSTLQFVRVGPEFRVGASRERLFGYALARIGLDILVGTPGTNAFPLFLAEIGAGFQVALGNHRRLLLGIEPAFDTSVPNPWLLFRARALVGARF